MPSKHPELHVQAANMSTLRLSVDDGKKFHGCPSLCTSSTYYALRFVDQSSANATTSSDTNQTFGSEVTLSSFPENLAFCSFERIYEYPTAIATQAAERNGCVGGVLVFLLFSASVVTMLAWVPGLHRTSD